MCLLMSNMFVIRKKIESFFDCGVLDVVKIVKEKVHFISIKLPEPRNLYKRFF